MTSINIKSVGQIGVPVIDLGRAINFYQHKLGLNLLFNTESMAFFELDGTRLLLSLPEKAEYKSASSVLYFKVTDIQAVYSHLNNDIEFIDEPHLVAKIGTTETWMVFFKDSENNTHAFMSEINPS